MDSKAENYFVYILQSLKDGGFYIGQCKSIEARIELHNKGKVTSTKHRRPFKLIYKEVFDNRREACKREWHLKHPKGYQEKLSIIKCNSFSNAG